MITANWTMADYIHSYSAQGVVDYIRYGNLLKIYNKLRAVQQSVLLQGATGYDGRAFYEGRLTLTEMMYENAAKSLRWLAELKPTIDATRTSKRALEDALLVVYWNKECDNDRMAEVLQRRVREFPEITTTLNALKALSDFYNYRSRMPRVFFDTDYIKLKEGMEVLK